MRQRFADQIGAADDNRVQATQFTQLIAQQHQTAERGAGGQRRFADAQSAGVDHGQAVDVLVWIDAIDHPVRIDLLGQRQLDQNTMHFRILVQALDELDQRRFAGVFREPMFVGIHPGRERHLALAADIDLARRIIADQDDGQSRGQLMLFLQIRDGVANPCSKTGGIGLAVDQFRCIHHTLRHSTQV